MMFGEFAQQNPPRQSNYSAPPSRPSEMRTKNFVTLIYLDWACLSAVAWAPGVVFYGA
jgi:hypothetical protein